MSFIRFVGFSLCGANYIWTNATPTTKCSSRLTHFTTTKYTLHQESRLVLVSDEAPTLLPFVLVHFFLAFLDNAGHKEFR